MNNELEMGCKICRALNDGWCMNVWAMSSEQKRELAKRVQEATRDKKCCITRWPSAFFLGVACACFFFHLLFVSVSPQFAYPFTTRLKTIIPVSGSDTRYGNNSACLWALLVFELA